jgi:hypothetical protein
LSLMPPVDTGAGLRCRCSSGAGERGGYLAVQFEARIVNAAVVAVYFTLVWGGDGFRILRSPFHGFEDRLHATAAAYFRALLDWT